MQSEAVQTLLASHKETMSGEWRVASGVSSSNLVDLANAAPETMTQRVKVFAKKSN